MPTIRAAMRLRRVQVTGQPPRLGTCFKFSRVPISRSRARVAAKKRPKGRPVRRWSSRACHCSALVCRRSRCYHGYPKGVKIASPALERPRYKRILPPSGGSVTVFVLALYAAEVSGSRLANLLALGRVVRPTSRGGCSHHGNDASDVTNRNAG